MQLSTQQARANICSSVAYHMTRQVQAAYVVALLHPDTGRIAYLSDNAAAVFEQPAETLLGGLFWELLTPECLKKTREIFDVTLIKSASIRLHSIQGFTELLQTKLEKLTIEKTQSYLAQIQTSGDRLLTLINDLLDLTKLTANKMQFHFAPHPLATLLESAIAEITPLSQANKQRLKIHGKALPTVVCDKDRMLQVFINLLSNAVKFSPPASQIDITVLHLEEEHRLRIIVQDHGTGIPTGELENIFSPFIQSSQHHKGGTGLGLAICRSILSAHEGRIWAENTPEGGACITIEFPDTLTADKDATP